MADYGENDRQGRGPESAQRGTESDSGLLSYVMTRVQRGRQVRDQKYAKRWKEYTRLWRGFWAEEDKNLNSERSRLITPALQQAIEMAAAEIEEALFNRSAWIDIEDDIADPEKDDAIAYRDQLLEDFDLAQVEDAIAKAVLLGAIYGTGIAKINVQLKEVRRFENAGAVADERVIVLVDAICPDEFVIDPAATSIDEAAYCAHEVVKPLHTVKAKQRAGLYKSADIGPWTGQRGDPTGLGTTSSVDAQDEGVLITEYYGKVPGKYVGEVGDTLVEAIVTVANETTVLRSKANPFTMRDRPVVAFQYDTVPGEFWGRGIAEKGYNPQKALDAEVRARMDALALMTAPMMGADITRMPRNPDLRVRPGKVFLTRGRPSEILEPVGFDARGLALTFQQASDMERMVQMGSGSMDSASPLSTNRRNETASGMSMLNAGFLKRSKRTMKNLERQFLDPLVRRCLWRYMQFDPERYPTDMVFRIRTAMGLMAKEVEQGQLAQMLGYLPPESPAHKIVVKAIFDNTASAEKDELKKAMDAMLQPPDPQQQQMQQMIQQIQLATAQAELAKTQAEAALAKAKAEREKVLASLEDDKVQIEAANAAVAAEQVRVSQRKVEVDRTRQASKPKSN